MSAGGLVWAYQQTNLAPAAKFVLVTLGHHADAGHGFIMHVPSLSERTGMKPEVVRSILNLLIEQGYIERAERPMGQSRRRHARYILAAPFADADYDETAA